MTSVVEMQTFNESDEQKNIKILNESLDKINETLENGRQAYKFLQTQTSKAEGTVNKKSHQEDLKDFKSRIDGLEGVKKEIKSEILKFEKKIAAKSKKGGRRTRKKRGKGGVISAMRNNNAFKQQHKKNMNKANDAFMLLYDKARKEAIQKARTKINPIINNKKYSLQNRKDRMEKILEKHPNLILWMGENGLEVKFHPTDEELKKMITLARANVYNPNKDYYALGLDETIKQMKPTPEQMKEFDAEGTLGYKKKKQKGGRRTRRRKSKRKKRRTRRAGALKQSKEVGKRGLTDREIDAREKLADARLKKSNPDAWKQKRLNKLKNFNKKMKNITKFGSTRKNLNLDMHKASGAFENLRLSPINSGPGESYNEFTARMTSPIARMTSPISFSSKKSTGGKKTRKKRRRKRRR